MPYRRRRNPQEFTPDEYQTAKLLVTDGSPICHWTTEIYKGKKRRYAYPALWIGVCDREALEPASRLFGTKISPSRQRKQVCPTHLFPPDGRGRWVVVTTGRRAERIAERLKPLLTKEFLRKWEAKLRKCGPRGRRY